MRRHIFGPRGGSVGDSVFHSRLVGRGGARSASVIFASMAMVATLLFAAPVFGQGDWYVNGTTGSDSNNGQTWSTAFATIQKAVTSAVQFGGYEIWVAKGSYVLGAPISIPWVGTKIPLKIYGGFESGAITLAERDWVDNLTVIDGNGVLESVVVINSWVDLIDGFTITGGTAGSLGTGGAIDIRGCSNAAPQPVFRNLVIRGNGGDTTHPPAYYDGGGIYIEDCSPWIVNVSFSNNRAWAHGGAVFARDSDDSPIDTYPTIINSTFTGNHSDVNGGAIGVYRGTLTVANSILWGDTAGDGVTHELFGGTLVVSSNDVGQPGYAGVNGNISQDPKMTGVGRFHLRDGSPCIDSGDDAQVPGWLLTDFDGDDRFVDGVTGTAGGTVDMGADEYVPGASAGVYYVDGASGNDMNSGTSWGSAFKTIQGAVAVGVSDAEVWVKQGTYTLTSSVSLAPINSNLAFYGGFAGTETLRSQRSTDASLTIVDGQNVYSCFNLAGLLTSHINNVAIDGFTLTRGNHAVKIVYADGTEINNCRLTDATADGAINAGQADLLVSNSLFSGNRANQRAGAIHMVVGADRLTVTDSTFINNAAQGTTFTTSGCGGAIRAGTGTIERSRFLDNTAGRHGGAVYNYSDFGEGLMIRNCEFSGNQAGLEIFGSGGATWGPIDIANSSFAGNSAPEWGVGGVSSATTITNSILWGNDSVANTLNTNLNCAGGRVFYSDVGDPSYAVVATCQTPYGNISADPLFVDVDGVDNTVGTTDDNLSLQSGSPAIDAGDSTALELGSLDLVGNPRHIDDPGVTDSGYGPEPIIDMGAHELQASTPGSTYDLTMAVSGNGSTSPSVGIHPFDSGSVISVTATASPGWQFTGWTGWVADPASESTTVTMTWDRALTANFKQVQTLALDVQGDGSGTVTSVPAGIICPGDCDEVFDYGTEVTLSAVVDSGTVFDGWAGGGCTGTDDCQLAMDEDLIVVAMCNLEGGCGIGDNVTLDNMVVDWVQSFEGCTSITLGSGFRVESPGDVIFRAADRVVLENGFSVGVGAYFEVQITGDVALRKIEVSKSANPTSAPEGDPITYTISVENTGNADLTEVSAADDKCTANPVYQSGDDGDTTLEAGETWVYQCSGLAEADSFVNTATMTFEDIFGQEVSDTGEAAVSVEIAACATNRYADMGNGTILDCNTDLLWLKDSSCSPNFDSATYANALTAVSSLADGTCGLSDGSAAGDWRLPTMNELCAGWISPNTGEVCWEASFGIPNMGLINNDCLCPAVSTTDGTCASVCGYPSGDPFVGVGSGSVWTSTEKDGSNMWSAELYQGWANGYSKTATAVVWPVRPR